MALSGKERTKKFEQDQAKRGLVHAPRGWVPEGTAWIVKNLMDQLCRNHHEQTDSQPE